MYESASGSDTVVDGRYSDVDHCDGYCTPVGVQDIKILWWMIR